MPIPPAFQMGLQFFRLERDTSALRQEIWMILGPRLNDLFERYWNECVVAFAPFHAGKLERRRDEWARHLFHQTRCLFEKPFDEDWAARCKERVEYEISVDIDMRTRSAINHNLSRYLNEILRDNPSFSKESAFALAEVAADVLALDAANAMTLHYAAKVKSARAHAGGLRDVIQTFGESMEASRKVMHTVVTGMNDACAKLAQFTNTAVQQARTANQAVHEAAQSAAAGVAAMSGAGPQMNDGNDALLRVTEVANDAGVASLALQATEDTLRSAHEAAQLAFGLSRNLSGSAREIGQSVDALLDVAGRCGIQPLPDLAKAS